MSYNHSTEKIIYVQFLCIFNSGAIKKAGVVLGIVLHRFVILTCEIDMIMFGRAISPSSYVYSVLLTCLFSLVVNGGMFFKLRKIDMVESLKSAE